MFYSLNIWLIEWYIQDIIKDYNDINDGRGFFDQPIKTNDNIGKIATSQLDDYTNGCFIKYIYFKENYKLIAIKTKNSKTRCWSKSNTKNLFYWKSIEKCKDIFYYWRSRKKLFYIFEK